MRRREFIMLIGGLAAWPLAARTQQPERMRRIGVLMNRAPTDPEGQARLAAFQQGLISFRRSVDLQGKRLYHRRPESNIGFEATPEFVGCRVGTGFET